VSSFYTETCSGAEQKDWERDMAKLFCFLIRQGWSGGTFRLLYSRTKILV